MQDRARTNAAGPGWLAGRRALLASLGFALGAAGVAAGQCPSYLPGAVLGTPSSTLLSEVSGLAASRMNRGVLWVHNDSGDLPRVYAINHAGALLGVYSLNGADAIDWEDMAIGRGPVAHADYLYLGDIGDNANTRPEIQVYRVREPSVSPEQSTVFQVLNDVEMIRLAYPDGPRDAETLMVDVNGDLYIVSKRVTARGRVYRAAYPQSTVGVTTLAFVAELPWGSVSGVGGATGGDISADGSAVVIRRYTGQIPAATLWRRPAGMALGDVLTTGGCNLALLGEPQGEAIAFAPCGFTYLTTSEGLNQPIYRYEPRPGFDAPRGDSNCDGVVDFDDITCFSAALVARAAWQACVPEATTCRYECANDANGDGRVDFDDIGAFVAALASGS